MIIGYKRVSSKDQTTARQLVDVALDKPAYEDFMSGATKDRPELYRCLDTLREGDILYVHSVDRLSRSVRDLIEIVDIIIKSGATLKLVKEGLTISGSKDDMFSMCMINVMTSFAQLERAMSKERQREGIAMTKINGTRSGKPFGTQPLDMTRADEAITLCNLGNNIAEIGRAMKLSRGSIYKLLAGHTKTVVY
jgi:DNA invertase Pin-like site-specific DNA recombinase